jgi:hypothetical protein
MKRPKIELTFNTRWTRVPSLLVVAAYVFWIMFIFSTFFVDTSNLQYRIVLMLFILLQVPYLAVIITKIRVLKKVIRTMEIELLVRETVWQIIDPEGYKRYQKKRQLEDIFNTKPGKKE